MHGVGKYIEENGDSYEGEFQYNIREGKGVAISKNKFTIKGTFKANKPNGKCIIEFAKGDRYEGDVMNGVIEGFGTYSYSDSKFVYEGAFINEIREGKGKLRNESYCYDGDFKDDDPAILPNKILWQQVYEKEEDKGERDRIVAEISRRNKEKKVKDEPIDPLILLWQFGGKPISLKFNLVFQGEPYPNPNRKVETEEEKKAAKGKKKKDEVEEPEFITPAPVEVKQESGRQFLLEIGKYSEEKAWIGFPLLQGSPKKKSVAHKEQSKEGSLLVSNIKWEEKDSFKAGMYSIKVVDTTECSDPIPSVELPIMIIAQEEEKEVKKEAKAKAPKK